MKAAADPGQVPDVAGPLTARGAGPAASPADVVVEELFAAHALTLIRLASLLVRDRADAEDIVQDAFTATYLKLPRLRDTTSCCPTCALR